MYQIELDTNISFQAKTLLELYLVMKFFLSKRLWITKIETRKTTMLHDYWRTLIKIFYTFLKKKPATTYM